MPRILVIDDEESILRTFKIFLTEEGHEVLTARSYEEAMESLAGAEVDVVFSDIMLNGKSGIDVLREVKERGLSCLVIMVTAYPAVETASEAVRLGAFDYVTKPVVQETLLRLTDRALKYREALLERERYRSHLEAIFSSVGDSIVTVDREMRILEVNEAALSMCGLGKEAVGARLNEIAMPGKDGILEALRETLDGRITVKARRIECRRDGSPPQILSVSTSSLTDANDRFMGAVLVLRDETRLADLEHDFQEKRQLHRIVGKSEAIRKVYSLIECLANVDTTVLVTGESGTGKELVAEALHYMGARGSGPLVKVNCSALPENLLESELFGHVKGAFTGAATDREGRFQRADGGSILLDEVGDISHRVQLSLLRVIQEKEVERVGDSRTKRVDVRIIASTNRDLAERVASGAFREDLFYRLKVMEIVLPPLRDRREDIPLLTEYFMGKLNRKLGRDIRGISSDAESLFINYAWPGNVRELEHALEHAFIMCRQNTILVDHLPPELLEHRPVSQSVPEETKGIGENAVRQALEKTGWNVAMASRLLGIDRKTVYRKMSKYGIKGEPPA